MNSNKKTFMRTAVLALLSLPALLLSFSSASAAEFCDDAYYINETLPNGAKWDMCWSHRQREGIIFHHIRYTPKNGQRRLVLNHAAVAQIHVPYDDNGARYHDISDYGIGGNNMLNLNADECPGGTLYKLGGKNILCKQIQKRDFAYKSGNNISSGNSLSLFSVSPVGAYFYIPTWRFMDDGTIEPWIGATGALQRFGNNQSRGWLLGDNRIGISHLHNFFWKLDFDLNNTATDDVIEEINFPLVNGKRQRTTTTFTNEAARKVNPNTMRRWRIKDSTTKNSNNHSISYDILLSDTGHQDIGPASEPFTHNDFYVTRQRNEEKFASHNPSGAKNLAEFANGENITNQDTVIWAGVTFYHMPRSEDAPHMDAHWSHMQIVPRDWHASNPLGSIVSNTPPTVSAPGDQSAHTGTPVSLSIEASDVDGDTLSYSATGLPAGLAINANSGVINGTPTTAANTTVTVTVSDGQDSSSVQFKWLVSAVNTNNPPQINPLANRSGQLGDNVNLSIQASDPDGDTLSYTATGLPSGLHINTTTGAISGSLSTAGSYTVTIKVSDAVSNTTASFNWVVTAPTGVISNAVANNAIVVDGQTADWSGLNYFASDPDDVSGANNQIDWLKVAVAHSPQKVYLAYHNRQNVDPNNSAGNYIPWGWQAYIDTDNDASTGFDLGVIGADYLIEGNVVQRYTGTGGSWSWQVVEKANLKYNGSSVELSFNRGAIGNPQSARFVFVGESEAYGGTATDTYPDSGSFSYNFSGSSGSNTPPVVDNQQISVGSGASISLVLTGHDSDNDPLSFEIVQQPAHGSLSGSAPNLVYTANSGFTGSDIFKFIANDGTVDSQAGTVNITVTSGQGSGAISNYVNTPISIDGNKTDWGGLSKFGEDPDDAADSIDWRDVTFAHDAQNLYLLYNGWNNIDPGSASGSYIAWGWQTFIDTDKDAATGFQIGAIGADYVIEGSEIRRYSGSGTNWNWQQTSDLQSRYKNKVAEILVPRNLIGNATSVRVLFQGASEAYSGSSVDLYPDGANNTQASLRFFDYDFNGSGGSNTRPVAYAQTVATTTNTTVNINLVATDSDNNVLTYNIASNPTYGTLTGTAPHLRYRSEAGFVGQDSFSFNVNDGTQDSATVTVTINVTGSNTGFTTNLVSSINIDGNNQEWSSLTAFVNDPDDITGTNNRINWKKTAMAHNASQIYLMYQNYGAVNLDQNSGDYINWGWQAYLDTDNNPATGYVIGDIGADYLIEGTELQNYTGDGSSWSWQVTQSTILSYNADVVELGLARSLIGNPAKLKILFVGDNSAYSGSKVDNYPDNLKAFTYKLSGGSQRPTNRPQAKGMTVNAAGATTIRLSANDADNDAINFRVIEKPAHGSLTATNESRSVLVYHPDANFTGQDSFRFVANDGTYDSSVRLVRLKVTTGGGTPGSGSGGGGSFPLEWVIGLGFLSFMRRYRNLKISKI